jgi:hypothetical protein
MKKNSFRTVIFGALSLAGFLACSADPTQIIHPDAGGGAAGAGSTAGSSGSAGATGSGTAGSGAAGSTSAGAAGATAGAAGSVGAAGATAGVAGAGGADSPGTAGSQITGTAGAAGMGTAGAGTAGAAGGTAGAAASICTPLKTQFDCNNVLVGMDGYLNRDDAVGASMGSDASQMNCTPSDMPGMQKIYKEKHWQLKGPGITAGQMYKVDLHYYGIVECKSYVGGTGPAKTDPNETPNVSQTHNLWLEGSKDNGDHWNTYAFTITSAPLSTLVGIGAQIGTLPDSAKTYVINQCPGNHPEGHFTFNIDFPTSITIPGESYINYIEYDTNCRMIANCGAADAAQSCVGPYNIVDTVKNALPATNATFTQPIANTANPPSRGQWWLVDVTAVTAM